MTGASGLCYLDLVKLLPAHLSVLALDDGCLSNGAPFVFDSIDDVVSACMLALAKVRTALKLDMGAGHEAISPPPMRLLLAGWSYGGVVAIELARRLSVATSLSDSAQQPAAGPSPSPGPGPGLGPGPGPVQVVGVCLFDSPLVRPAPRSVDNAGTRTTLNTASSNTKIYTPQGSMLMPPPLPPNVCFLHPSATTRP
jgi:hypothetical protein